jgi:dihydroorotate dehydrogenase (fumarate)
MDLSTTYLGLLLSHPIVIGSGPLGDDIDMVKQLEDAGAAAVVLRSLYEEEIAKEQISGFLHSENYVDSSAEAESYFPDVQSTLGPEEYLEHVRRLKNAVKIPVVASLNGSTPGTWLSYALLLEQAGADALELNIYHSSSDPTASGAEVERQAIDIVREVKHGLHIPVAVKLSPFYTAFGHFAKQVDAVGADGIVLFNSLHSVDIDVYELEVIRAMRLSESSDLQLRLRGAAALTGRVKGSLAISGGVHTALDIVKATMVGAHVTQVVSALLLHGPSYLHILRRELREWMEKNSWSSLTEMRGNMGFDRVSDPGKYERENFRMTFRSFPDREAA